MGELIHIKTYSAKKSSFVLKLMVLLSSSLHGYKYMSAKKEGGVEVRCSAQGQGEGRIISFVSSAGFKCF